MPSIDINFFKKLKDDYTNYKLFVETGTLNGETIFHMEEYFDKLFTIEISSSYYLSTKNKYKNDKITFLLGDSSTELKNVLLLINENDNIIFFLDGHWSSGDTGRGKKDCPLLEEMRIINNCFKGNCIIIIDDFRLFGSKINEDWSNITKDNIIKIVNDRIINMYHLPSCLSEDDRLILHLRAL